jgi:hypothetical protein
MGLEQTINFQAGIPLWPAVQQLLTQRDVHVQMRMIDGELAFPDELPPEPWRELRVSGDAGMVTIRREAARISLVTWGNAEPPLLRLRNALAWALAAAGAGRIQTEQGEQTAEEFLRWKMKRLGISRPE